MLSPEDNALITRTGPGTPMGDLIRRFWIPLLISSELPAPDCTPVRVTLLGEKLVAFRDSSGKVGVVSAYCPHRRADLFFGRNEEDGLRCVYHGWKFDVRGTCVDMPNEPEESDFKTKIQVTAYPTEERGGIIWTYMGPAGDLPEVPDFFWMHVPDDHRYVTKVFNECNYLGGMEGDIDTSHGSFLHASARRDDLPFARQAGARGNQLFQRFGVKNGAPRFTVVPTDDGVLIGAERPAQEDSTYWRITQWLMPFYALIPTEPGQVVPCLMRVPIDDEHHWLFRVWANPTRPIGQAELAAYADGWMHPALIPGTYMPVQTRANNYLMDRSLQRSFSFTGIKGTTAQDRAVVEGPDPIIDRSQEHLGTTDLAIIAARRKLLQAARELQESGRVPHAALHGAGYRVLPAAVELQRGVPFDEGAKEFLVAQV